PRSTPFPYTTLFRSPGAARVDHHRPVRGLARALERHAQAAVNRGVSPGRRSYAALALAGSVAVLIVTCRADVARRLAPSVDAGPNVRAHPREPVMLKLRLSGSWKADGPRRFTI